VNRDFFSSPRTFAGVSDGRDNLDAARVVVLPVPYDSTVEYRSGTREGPGAIIDSSLYMELFDAELNADISQIGIHTLPELRPDMSSPERMVQRVESVVSNLLKGDKLIAMVGGEHTLTVRSVKAYQDKFPEISVLQLDAHADLRDQYMGTPYNHATVMRRIWEICPFVQAGVRSLSREEHAFIEDKGLEVVYAEPWDSKGIDRIVSTLSPQVYVSVDLDVFDPSLMPAVGTPEPGGLSWQEVLEILYAVALRKDIVGFDVVELCPAQGPASCPYIAAKLVYKLIGYSTLLRSRT
jgi:agmatinase